MVNEIQGQGPSFNYLPSFAAWLLTNIDEYTKELVRLFYEVDLPLLKAVQHLSEEERFQFSKRLNIEFLTNLSQNNASGHLQSITNRWLADQFENIGRLDVDARDVTLINYVRSKAQKKFINQYTADPQLAYHLHSEIDDLAFAYNARSINDYLQVLKDKIEQETYFSRNIIDASPGITFIYDLIEQQAVYINGRVREVTGYTPEEVLATKNSTSQLIHQEDKQLFENFIGTVIAEKEGRIYHTDYRIKNKSGMYQWMRSYAVVYRRDSHGQATQLLGIDFDISTEKETALALQKREQQLLEAQSIGKIGSFEWNIRNDTSVSTPELRKIFEVEHRQSLSEMLGNTHPDDVEKVKEAISQSFKTGVYACEFRYLATSGIKVIDGRGVITFSEEKIPLFLTGTIQDVTERKQIEENLRQNTVDLERSNEQLQQFASIASHDLKEPLRKIGMFTNIIMTSDWDSLHERTKINIQKISEAAIRMQKLIEGVLSYSSINAQVSKEKAGLEDLLQEAIRNLEYKVVETGAVITSDGLPEVEVISLQIQQLFQNLIANALKFSKKMVTPEVRITHRFLSAHQVQNKHLSPAKQYLQIDITDNGIGFSQAAAEKIFGLFQRLHGRADYEGSGIGLAICKRIVENHGGWISATSDVGVGSTLSVILPV